MRTLNQEALRLTDKIIVNLRSACAIADGRKNGSIFELERNVAIAHNWCKDLLDMTLHMKYTDKTETKEHELLKQSRERIDELFDVLSSICKCLRGETKSSLHQIQLEISGCEIMANLLKESIVTSQDM